MASLLLNKLQPGKTYTVMVRAKDSDGNISGNSITYTFTTPKANLNGTQLTSVNSAVVTALANDSACVVGGALTAGALDTNGLLYAGRTNLANIWNSTSAGPVQSASITGTASAGAVIINSTGILGYQFNGASAGYGTANFYLNTLDGNAYFRGTIYAGAGQIGGWTIGANALTNSNVGMVGTFSGNTGELTTNGDFETGDFTGWTALGTNNSINNTAPVYSGSWRFSGFSSGSTGVISTSYIPVVPGNPYQLSAYMYKSTGTVLGDLFIYWYNSSSTLIATSSGTNTLTSSYVRYILGATSPSTAAYAKVQVNNEAGSNGTFSLDLISFTGTITPSSEIAFYSGSAFANRALAPFRVDYAGNLIATNASITGYINSSSGNIGGWAINPSTLSGSSTTTNLLQAYDPSFENQSKYSQYWQTYAYNSTGTGWGSQVINSKNPYTGRLYTSTVYGLELPGDAVAASSVFTMLIKSSSAAQRFTVSDLGLTPGSPYVFSAYVKLSDLPGYANNASVAILYVGQYAGNSNTGPGNGYGGSNPGTLSSGSIVLTASWQRVSASFIAGSSASSVMPYIRSINFSDSYGTSPSMLSLVDIDAVQLEAGQSPTPYNVGNYVNLSSSSILLSSGFSSSITNMSLTNTGNLQAEYINAGIITSTNLPFAVSTGVLYFASAVISTGGNIAKTVYFPNGRFSTAPVVAVNIMNGGTNAGFLTARAINTTVSGTTIRLYNSSGTSMTAPSVNIGVVAIQQGTSPWTIDTMQ